MVAYNFQSEFGPRILDRIKCSTIRRNGKRRHAVKGDEVQLYTGQRTKACRLLGRSTCLYSRPIEIHRSCVYVDGSRFVTPQFFAHLAGREGFADFAEMQAWFDQRYGLPFVDATQIRWSKTFLENGPEVPAKGASR